MDIFNISILFIFVIYSIYIMVNFCELDDSVPNPTNVCGVTRVIMNSDNRQNEKKYKQAELEYKNILPSIVFIMQSIDTLICYGKRICAYRMGIKKIYDRKPFLVPTDYGIKKSIKIAQHLGKF